MIGIEGVVKLSHVMEDVFVAAQNKKIELIKESVDQIFTCNDLLQQIETLDSTEVSQWTKDNTDNINSFIALLDKIHDGQTITPVKLKKPPQDNKTLSTPAPSADKSNAESDSMVRVSTSRINKLVGLAGELTVSSN